MEQLALEGIVESTYRRAGCDAGRGECPRQLALALWRDPDAVQAVPRIALRRTRAVLARVNRRRRIYIRNDVGPLAFGFLIAHELSHGIFDDEGIHFVTEAEEEVACDALAGALIVPRRAFASASRAFGGNVEQMAVQFRTTESLCLLRMGEVTGRPLALVRPGLIRTRGDAPMPSHDDLARWARGRAPAGWVRSSRVDGERARVSLVKAA